MSEQEATVMARDPAFEWQCHPEAEAWLRQLLDQFVSAMPACRALAADLRLRTGGRLVDWLDHLVLADGDRPRGELADLGFTPDDVPVPPGDSIYHNAGSIFPRVVLRAGVPAPPGQVISVAVQAEEISSFLAANHSVALIEGSLLSPYRRARLWQEHGRELAIVERRGWSGFVPRNMPRDYPLRYLRAFEQWAARPRLFADERKGMAQTLRLARSLVGGLGVDDAAWVAFAAERAHWQQRNRAGQVQRARQDSLGLGWANHDHHTFRSSRATFSMLIEILETLGFHPRERFYAGQEAGWGAQVMEQPTCRLAVFADVDLSPEEVEGDFAHQPLAPREELGTVGLWCALHGESMLGAGLHHVASRFDFEAVTSGLSEWGIKMMRPFSDFPHLRQAFTEGQRWTVAPERLALLGASGQLTEVQCAQFSGRGAIGSHLENIQRGEGFKGFNQQRVSDIIRRTDPREIAA